MQKLLLIIHGRSPLRTLTERGWKGLSTSLGFHLDIAFTAHAGHAESMASHAAGYDLVVACGGDGTHHEVINGLMCIPADQRPSFAPMAGGSGNDFARIRTALSAQEVFDAFQKGGIADIPLLELSWQKHRRYALNVSTAGIGAEIAQLVNRRKFKLPPAFNYYTAILHWLAKYQAPHLSIHANEQLITKNTPSFLLAIGNGKYAGNGLGLCPQAELITQKLALTVIGNVGVLDFLKYQSTLQRCEEVRDPRVHYHTAAQVSVAVEQGTLSIEADGEFICSLEAGETITYKKTDHRIRLI